MVEGQRNNNILSCFQHDIAANKTRQLTRAVGDKIANSNITVVNFTANKKAQVKR